MRRACAGVEIVVEIEIAVEIEMEVRVVVDKLVEGVKLIELAFEHRARDELVVGVVVLVVRHRGEQRVVVPGGEAMMRWHLVGTRGSSI